MKLSRSRLRAASLVLVGLATLLVASASADVSGESTNSSPKLDARSATAAEEELSEIGATAAALRPDGKIVAGGGANYGFALARYTSGGALDRTFGKRGITTTQFPISGFMTDLALLSSGRIVAVGQAYEESARADFMIARYMPNGALDASFGVGGKVTTDFGGEDGANAVAVGADGKIVVGGFSWTGDNEETVFALAQYRPDGSLDTGFGGNGKVTTSIGSSGVVYDLAVGPDGKIVAVGRSYSSEDGSDDFAVVRYDADGSLDESFGTHGSVTTSITPEWDDAYAVALQPNGKIVAGGRSGDSPAFTLVRYELDGRPDATFGSGGSVTTTISGDHDEIYSLALQSDGRIVAAGFTLGSDDNFALARYEPDGTLDEAFASGGVATTVMSLGADEIFFVGVQPDSKIVAVGSAERRCACFASDFALTRYTGRGALDVSFGRKGKVQTEIVPSCLVPNVVGLMLPRARQRLTTSHCRAGKIFWRHARARKGSVLEQEVRPGLRLGGGTSVRLLVSRGPKRR